MTAVNKYSRINSAVEFLASFSVKTKVRKVLGMDTGVSAAPAGYSSSLNSPRTLTLPFRHRISIANPALVHKFVRAQTFLADKISSSSMAAFNLERKSTYPLILKLNQ